jgi:poly(ADP-ribose) glycohydrolase ARH3
MPDLRSRFTGSLLGLFCGDALGMPYEDRPPDAIPERLEMEDARRGRGTYSDDTQMAIAVAESLLRCDAIDEADLAATIVEAFDPGRGYGPTTTLVVERWRAAGGPTPDGGDPRALTNGAAMRVAPVGLRFAFDPERCAEEACRQARLTHAHPLATDGAVAVAAAVAAAVRGEDHLLAAIAPVETKELRRRLARAAEMVREGRRRAGGTEVPVREGRRRAGGTEVSGEGRREAREGREAWPPAEPGAVAATLGATFNAHESVPAALLAACAPTFEEALTFAVRCGGDTDTVAAMAGAVAGARHGVEAIPRRWLEALEDGEKGRSHVEGLAARLAVSVSAT